MDESAERVLDVSIQTMKNALKLCNNKFSALLIVLKYGARFTKQESDFIKTVRGILGKNVIRDFGVCIMTHGDNFEADNEDENLSFELWYHQQEGDVKQLFEECNYRCVLFNNRTKDERLKDSQLSQLITMLPRNAHYTESDFKAANIDLQKLIIETRMPRILKETNVFLAGQRQKIKTMKADEDIGKQIQTFQDVLFQVNQFEQKLIKIYQVPDNIQQALNVINIFKMELKIKLKNCEQTQMEKEEEARIVNMDRSNRDSSDQNVNYRFSDDEDELLDNREIPKGKIPNNSVNENYSLFSYVFIIFIGFLRWIRSQFR